MAKRDITSPASVQYGDAPLTAEEMQSAVNAGKVNWRPDMKVGKEDIMPMLGTGYRPAEMPKWAEGLLGNIATPTASGGRDISQADIAQALRRATNIAYMDPIPAAAPAPVGVSNPYAGRGFDPQPDDGQPIGQSAPTYKGMDLFNIPASKGGTTAA